jgi:hypothetical protein
MIFVIAVVVVVSLVAGFVWFALRNARNESVWQVAEDAKDSASVQPNVAPPDKPKAKAAHV